MTETAVEPAIPDEVLEPVPVETTEHLSIPSSGGEVIVPLGADLAAKYPERYGGIRRPISERDDCPVCGFPNGDCAPHNLPG